MKSGYFNSHNSLVFLLLMLAFPVQSQEVAKTIRTLNDVVAIQNDTSRNIKRGHGIFSADTVQTGDKARGHFRFYDGTLMTLGANSQMTVSKFEAKKDANDAALEFTKGAFRIITGLITKTDNPNFSVSTPVGTIGVRGTDFWGGNLTDSNSVDIILLDSEHPLTVENRHGKVLITQAGFGTQLTKGKTPSKPVKWSDEKLGRAVETISFPQ